MMANLIVKKAKNLIMRAITVFLFLSQKPRAN